MKGNIEAKKVLMTRDKQDLVINVTLKQKNKGKLTNHVAKHISQEISDDKSKTSTNIIGNLK